MQPVWLCILSSKRFEETFEKAQWRKIKQMQPVWLCLLWPKFFDETHKQAQSRRKVTIWHREQTFWCIKIDEININILHNDKGKLFCFLQRGAKKLGSKLMMTIIRGGVKKRNIVYRNEAGGIPNICHFSPPTQFFTKIFSTQKRVNRAKTDLTKTA